MHDVNRSGWFMLVPIADLIWGATKSDPGANRFGAPSPYTGRDFAAVPSRVVPVAAPVGPASPVAAGVTDPFAAIEKLDDLHTRGILTDAEFDAQKKALLTSL